MAAAAAPARWHRHEGGSTCTITLPRRPGFSAAELTGIERGNALRILPKIYRT